MARKKKQRGEYGAGTTYQNKKGEWFAAFPLGNGQRDTRRVADKQAGDTWRAEMKRQRDEQHIDIATAQTLFVTYAENFIGDLRKQKPSTIESYRDLLEYYILDFVEGTKLADLRMRHFTTMLHTLLDEGYAISQIRNAINLAARILDVALANDLVPKNYAALVRKDIPTNPESIGKVLTVEQTITLLDCARWRYHDDGTPIVERGKRLANRHALGYWFYVLFGLRKGELLGLRWSSIDYENQLFTVDQQVRELDGGCKLIPPKSEAAKRVMPLTPYVIEMLRDLWETQQAERLHWGLDWHEHGLVFPAENGNPKIPSNLLREYKRILTAAEIDAETRLHDLRHTAATRAGEHGMDEYVIAAMLGHGKKNVTRRYAKAMADQMRPAILLAERVYLDGSARKADNS
jgi:integrase